MRRLLIVLAVFLAIAVGAGMLGIFLADDMPSLSSGRKVLVWHVDERVMDYSPRPGWSWFDAPIELGLVDIYQALVSAKSDPSVEAVVLYVHNARFGIAKAQQLRRLLVDLKQADKPVECYVETAGEGFNGTLTYYLTSVCDQIHLAPGADLNLLGLLADRTFLRGTFDKLKIEPDFEHVGRFKSAVESYTMSEGSDSANEALSVVLDDYFGQIVTAIAAARGLESDRVVELIDGAPYTAQEALDLGLVDALDYPDQFADYIDEQTDGATLVDLADYGSGDAWNRGPRVAVVFAQGVIRRGHGGVEPWTGELSIGSRDFGRLLRELGDDDSVSAVVLRIDSPGGSALASDLILREAEILGEKKPLIVSMSDVAASGGYYIAAKAQHIVAEEATLTGSIGVYGGKLVTREFEKELLGISHDPLQRGANADIYSSLEPFSPEQSARLQTLMQRVYDDFIGHVATGREMTPEAVEDVAQGRVWTGRRASEIGLVDEIGGLDVALSLARQELDIETDADIRLDLYPRPPELFDYLLGRAQPFLPIRIPEAIRLLDEDHFRLLQLPPGIADLANPF